MRIMKNQVWKHKTKRGLKIEILGKDEKRWKVKLSGPKNVHLFETFSPNYIKMNFEMKELTKNDVS